MSKRAMRVGAGAPTIADVAAESGFSPMTVSRVINDERNVREETREAVQRAIARLNYSPNLAARSLAGAEQIRIGMVYSNPSAAYLSRFLLGSLEEARLHQAQLIIEKSDTGAAADESALRQLLATGAEGVILSPPLCDSPPILELIADAGTPAVMIANWSPPGDVLVVRIDDRAAAAAMTRHILALGHRRIAFVMGDPAHRASSQRLAGFCQTMQAAGVVVAPDLLVQGQFTYRSGMAAAEYLLNLPQRPTAIFAGNDDMAAAIVAVAHRRQLSVPADLSVCGFDDTDFARSIWPELTTIRQPIAEMAQAAVKMLVGAVRARRAGRLVGRQEEVLDFELIRRESDGPPPAG